MAYVNHVSRRAVEKKIEILCCQHNFVPHLKLDLRVAAGILLASTMEKE